MATFADRIGAGLASLNDVSTVVGVGNALRESCIYIEWGTGVTAGEITIETAASGGYAGTDSWAPLAVVNFTTDGRSAPKCDVVQVTGAFLAMRARVSGALSGGTAAIHFLGN